MEAFSELLDRLAFTPSRNAKLGLLKSYFRERPDPDRGWALAILTDGLPFSLPVRRVIQSLVSDRFDDHLFRLSREYVGDTAETLALLWPDPSASHSDPPKLATVIAALATTQSEKVTDLLENWLCTLDAKGRWALLKMLTGAPRVGVSTRLAKLAVALAWDRDSEDIEEIWHGVVPPYEAMFAWLDGRSDIPDVKSLPVFRPVMLANSLEDEDFEALALEDFAIEWKWDGVRVQIVNKLGDVRLYSRTGDDISKSFPDVLPTYRDDSVLDGELLIKRDGNIASFSDLQRRLNRKSVSSQMLEDYPAHIILYDILEWNSSDLRGGAFVERREQLQSWFRAVNPERYELSELLELPNKTAARKLWQETRACAIEGLMLKRWASPYLRGRPKGHWYKWKRAPLTVDCVLMYAQRGSGRRSSYYSDFTFGAWKTSGDGEDGLVPVGKAYSGYSDDELIAIDRWVRRHTKQRFGPVCAVTPGLVFEVAFDSIHTSKRHKSGVAMRFPRIHRIRWDKPVQDADRLDTIIALIS
ncbi:MAG: cisplatin damage response ATP-dependent DNA ligase [Hyphomicrobiaceae bacterium]